jgi:hypothetical protein
MPFSFSGCTMTGGILFTPDMVLYPFTSFTFTNASITGSNGPTLANCLSSYNTTTYPWLTNTSYFNVVTQGYQLWTVPSDGTYTIDAYGAAGGPSGFGNAGGAGARIKGDFSLTKGTKLKIVVGQMGTAGSTGPYYNSGGGGGGTFVMKETGTTNSDIYVIAGGGGGYSYYAGAAAAGGAGQATSGSGAGGNPGSGTGAGGGGSITSSGASTSYGTPGASFSTTAAGGTGSDGSTGFGGFGGGAGQGFSAGGGAGGQTGGKGGDNAAAGGSGGGSSYNNGTNQTNTAGARTAAGQVIITFVG